MPYDILIILPTNEGEQRWLEDRFPSSKSWLGGKLHLPAGIGRATEQAMIEAGFAREGSF